MRRLSATIAAAAAAAAVWTAAVPVAGVRLLTSAGGHAAARPVGLAAVITVSLLAGLAGWALLAVMERRARRPRAAWTVAACSVMVVSLTGPLTSGRGAAAITTLACMHLATGGVLILALRSTARR